MASILIGFGIVLAALGFLMHSLAANAGRVSFLAGLTGGGLSVLWGAAALAGLKGRAWAMLSVAAGAFVLLIQAGNAWTASAGDVTGGATVRLLVTAMFLLTVGMLMYLMHGERPPEFYNPNLGGRNDASAKAGNARSQDGRPQR